METILLELYPDDDVGTAARSCSPLSISKFYVAKSIQKASELQRLRSNSRVRQQTRYLAKTLLLLQFLPPLHLNSRPFSNRSSNIFDAKSLELVYLGRQ